MEGQFTQYISEIKKALHVFLQQKEKELSKINAWGSDVCKRYEAFAISGKMIRGSLTMLGFELFGLPAGRQAKKTTDDVIKAAAAMELFQSALLIHDDIMDRDTTRRGMDTIFTQYEKLGLKQNVSDSHHFGQSQGICVGDIGFFLGFELVSNVPQILSLLSQEFTNVGIAQMQDVYSSHASKTLNEKEIFNLYQYKTARYTFSLPLMIGASIAGQPKHVIKNLEQLGEHLGIIFQLVDDELDVEKDKREGKKTLLAVYGRKKTRETIEDVSSQAQNLIVTLPIEKKYKDILLELLAYNKQRTK